MPTIRAFRGLRYDASAGSISTLVAPPYDVLSPEERDRYAAQSEYNVVHLTLPEQIENDRSKFVKYARSAGRLEEWRRTGKLRLEDRPTLYRYVQRFRIPGSDREFVRTSVVTLIRLEPYEKGVVLPHEQTFPKHKEDRLRLLEATRSHLECIYGLYEDPAGTIHGLVAGARGQAVIDIQTDDEVHHLVECIDDPEVLAAIERNMAPQKVWIADGHHRYETACTFREQMGPQSDPVAEDYMMMALSSMNDPGLVILPTHRIVPKLGVSAAELRTRLEERFTLEECPNGSLVDRIAQVDRGGARAIGIGLPGEAGLVALPKDLAAMVASMPGPGSERLKALDVCLLHTVIFDQALGLTGLDFFSYTRDPDAALAAVRNGAEAVFLMNPPTSEDMQVIALGGEKMPQKSTYYYPKLLSGLVIWSLKDFAG